MSSKLMRYTPKPLTFVMSGFHRSRIEASGHAASAPPFTGSVQELLVNAHVAVFVGEVVHVMADAFGNRTCRLSAPYVDVQRREDISDEHRIQATPIPRIHRDGEGATIHRGIGVHERLGNMRAHNVVHRQSHPVFVGVAHTGDFVVSEVETQRPLLTPILCQVQQAAGSLCESEATHPRLPSAIGGEMLVEVGSAVFDDHRLSKWLVGGGGGPRVHEVHRRLHVADRVMP